ncbi:MAG: family oxidoreductase [Actinomycetia bacterium]|nr:family oxidoreductase [Actinomycetes bacterium]
MGRLDGKVALVTGAARGIGEATARAFVAEGAEVTLADKRDDVGQAVADELGARYLSLDVTSEEAWAGAIASIGGLDVLVNNAGIMRNTPLLETDLETFRKVLDTNLVSAFLGTKAVVPAMQGRGGGSIVNFSSPQGLEGRHGMSAYTASKFGVRGFTRTAAMELGEHGIRVNAVIPGPTRTAMTTRAGWTDDDYDAAYGGYPLGRMGRPEEIAAVCVFLASDESSFCTGADFVADGGVLAGKPR